MKKLKRILTILIPTSIGVYIGKWLWLWIDYTLHPELYALNSAPWYVQMIPYTGMAAVILLVELLAYIIVCCVIKKRAEQK